jgi:hypothetical protein
MSTPILTDPPPPSFHTLQTPLSHPISPWVQAQLAALMREEAAGAVPALSMVGLSSAQKALLEGAKEVDARVRGTFEEYIVARKQLAEAHYAKVLKLYEERRRFVVGEESVTSVVLAEGSAAALETSEAAEVSGADETPTNTPTESSSAAVPAAAPADAPLAPGSAGAAASGAGEEADVAGGTKGIPNFWVQAMQHSELFSAVTQPHDLPVLEYLRNIEWAHLPDLEGFRLAFTFAPNPYFEDRVLTKGYPVADFYNPLKIPEPDLVNAQGTVSGRT